MDKCVFVHTNERQWLGALVAEYSFRRNSAHADKFDVRFIHTRDYPYLAAKEGQTFLRGGTTREWHMDDLQSFTPLRFLPPKLMSWQGRAGWPALSDERRAAVPGLSAHDFYILNSAWRGTASGFSVFPRLNERRCS